MSTRLLDRLTARLGRAPSPRPARLTAPPAALQRQQGVWLLAAAAITLAPHGLWLPIWIYALCGLLLTWRGVLLWRGSRPPPHLLLLALSVAAGVGVRLEFGHFFGKDPGVALLALLLGLKLLETRAARDIRVGVLLCLFLQLALFLEDQSIAIAGLALLGTLTTLGALVALADPAASVRDQLRSAAVLLAHGLPFMLVFFLLFPRIQGPLWGLPADAFSARTGLSDTMSPGSISELGQSTAIAFRAAFEGSPPPPAQRYWRGPVLTEFDGRNWSAAPFTEAAVPFYRPAGPRLDYALTLEAHNRRWLLALDYPGEAGPEVRFASDHHALSIRAVQARSRFLLNAYPEARIGSSESVAVLAAATRLPPDSNPRSRALAARLAEGAASHAEILERVIAHLRANRLQYTLRPPLLGRHSADEFLFDTRRGFCEHFASAFAVVMRAAGVPTRIVTGYQGGEINPIDRYVVVRQSDAHAWAEVWLADRGWLRVDPTALSAPERIDDGLAAALADGSELPFMLQADLAWLRDLRHRWEAVSNAWNQQVLGYNPERQRELLDRLGLGRSDVMTLAGVLAGLSALLLAGLYLWAVRKTRSRDPLQRAWERFCTRMARAGFARESWEGPLAYGERLASALPGQAQALRAVCATYARLRYGPAAPDEGVRELDKLMKEIRIP
ncbi:MAG: transglutaminase TgpA family protein [Thauera sp.]